MKVWVKNEQMAQKRGRKCADWRGSIFSLLRSGVTSAHTHPLDLKTGVMADVSQAAVGSEATQEAPAQTGDAQPVAAAEAAPAAATVPEGSEGSKPEETTTEASGAGLPDYSRNLFLQRAPVDEWIARLRKNIPLSAAEVKQLCKLVRSFSSSTGFIIHSERRGPNSFWRACCCCCAGCFVILGPDLRAALG